MTIGRAIALDPRLALRRERVAAGSLEGVVEADRYVATQAMQARVPVAPLHRAPDDGAEQLDQLLFGERFEVLERTGDFALGQARRNGYVGYVAQAALAPAGRAPTHQVRAVRTAVLAAPAVRAPRLAFLSLNALVRVERQEAGFVEVAELGWVAAVHLARLGEVECDPAAAALRFLGVPYVWGGRDSLGLDCSGLVQQALYACGRAAPRDSDQQQALGQPVSLAAGLAGMQRNDLVFWRGHVGLMLDTERLLHANAHHMAVAVEPVVEAAARIRAAGGGEPVAVRRLGVQTPAAAPAAAEAA